MIFKKRDLGFSAGELHKLIRAEEPNANIIVADVLLFVAAVYFAAWLAFKAGTLETAAHVDDVAFLGSSILMLLLCIACLLLQGEGRWLKYAMFLALMLSVLAISVATGFKVWMIFAIPIALSCRYTNARFTGFVGVLAVAFVVLTGLCNIYVSPGLEMIDLNTVIFNHTVTLEVDDSLFSPVAAVGIGPDELARGTVMLSILPNVFIVIAVSIACIAVTRNDQRLMAVAEREARAKAELELELERGRSRLMVSQIQPHFLYNALTAIMAIEGNPDETVDAIGDFGKYLRENLSSLSSDEPIPFEQEIVHVKRYASLEELRFGDGLDIRYDLKAGGFVLPALSVQVLVENAIKHGITKEDVGDWVEISSFEEPDSWVITVQDNGAGFDVNLPIDESQHFGLANVRKRLGAQCNGSLAVESAPGSGTTAIIRIPK